MPWLSMVHRQASSLVPIPVPVNTRRTSKCQKEMKMESQPREETTDQPHGVIKSVMSTVLPSIPQLTPEPTAHSCSI